VLEAADGEAGFQCALEEHPDIILLDVMMPIRGQFEVLQKLKSNRATSAALVIMVSAKGQEQDINTAMDAGAWNYIVKPWEQEDLEAKVMAAAEKAQKAA
jgi:two-component system phosphate regulon response regulator PhoB